MSTKWESNKTKKRNALLDNAFELFMTKGINKTSIADIVEHAGVAKGTFYLYFKDKEDIRNKLILHKLKYLFVQAEAALAKTEITDFMERVLYVTDQIIDMLQEDTSLLILAARNLNWGSFKKAVLSESEDESADNLYSLYISVFEHSPKQYRNTEVLVYMLLEFITSTCYNSILNQEPVFIEELKPYLYSGIRALISSQELPSN